MKSSLWAARRPRKERKSTSESRGLGESTTGETVTIISDDSSDMADTEADESG